MGGEGTITKLRPVTDPSLDLPGDPDHLVCCRASWDYTLCGLDTSNMPVVPFSNHICPDCLAEAENRYSRLGVNPEGDEMLCVETGKPCPEGEEADAMWRRVLDRDS